MLADASSRGAALIVIEMSLSPAPFSWAMRASSCVQRLVASGMMLSWLSGLSSRNWYVISNVRLGLTGEPPG